MDPLVLTSNELLRERADFAFSISKFNDRLIEIAQMPALRKGEKEKLIRQTSMKIEEHLANSHIELHLKQLHLQITRMKYSEAFS